MKPLPVHPITGESAARVLLLLIVRILAIAGIVMSVGVIIILLEPIILLTTSDARMVAIVNWQGFGVPAFPYRHNTMYFTAATGVLLLASSVAALSLRPWGRVGMTWYGIATVAHLCVLLFFPPLYWWHYGKLKPNAEPNLINSVRDVAIYIAVAVTSMIYPALVIVVMRHPAVVGLFQKVGIGFEPTFAQPVTSNIDTAASRSS